MEAVQYSGGCSVQWRANISTVRGEGVSISTVEAAKYGGGLISVQSRHSIEYSGGCSVRWRANISTLEG